MPLDCASILNRLGESKPPPEYHADPVLEPFRHIHSEPGKGVRDMLIAGFNHWLGIPEDQVWTIASAVAKLHTASLLIDDIEDSSLLRRGLPAAHTIYGIPQTINAANYMYFIACQELFSLPPVPSRFPPMLGVTRRLYELFGDSTTRRDAAPKCVPETRDCVVQIVTSEILSLHQGQGLEILWRDNLECPSEEDYVDMVVNKTGGLLRISIKLMELYAQVKPEDVGKYIRLVNLIAVYYQIRDDYMNLQSKEYESKKGLADDLTEGKFSFPIIHGIQSDRTNKLLLNILRARSSIPALKTQAISYLSQKGSFAYTFKILEDLEQCALDEIERLGGNPQLVTFMKLIRCPDLHSLPAADGV